MEFKTEHVLDDNQLEYMKIAYGIDGKRIACVESDFQKIEVIRNFFFGKMLFIDDFCMMSEKDEFVYHEMISHVPMNILENPTSVAVIGGGDGGTVKELGKYQSLNNIDLIEIDEKVIEVSRKYLSTGQGFNDPRVKVKIEDGFKYLKYCKSYIYDMIVSDSTDPIGPGKILFSEEYFKMCRKCLKPDGILVTQGLSPWIQVKEQKAFLKNIRSVFKHVKMYTATIPSYPCGYWSFVMASNTAFKPLQVQRASKISKKTKYYNIEIHEASFALPNFLKEIA